MRTFWRTLVVVTLLALLPPFAAQAAETRLWIVKPAPAGNLSDCPERAANAVQAGSADARPLTSEAVVSWQGGQVRLRGTAEVEDQERDLWDRCFALTVDGHVVISGAILVPHSARVLRFPVLQVPTWRSREQIPEFKLTPAFPADRSTLSLQEWRWRLSHLH